MGTRSAFYILVLSASLAFVGATEEIKPAAPTFQELMQPDMFPEPQRGMAVESADANADSIAVRTTGALFSINADGAVSAAQRIGHERTLAVLHLDRPLATTEVLKEGPGFSLVSSRQPALTVRINGDSLLMLHVHEPLRIRVESKILPAWHASFNTNHLIADEWGAFGLYCSERMLDDRFDPYGEVVASYDLPAGAVLWFAVCPPKPYDWDRSFRDHVIWHWSNTLGYPPDETLRAWQPHGSTVLLQSEVMLWQDWNLDFVPRLGVEEFARVRETLHALGMRFIVYTSPYYFLKGTPLASHALNSFEGFTNWPPGSPTGENMGLFMRAITRVMNEYRPDGLYFDGQYTGDPAALYALARSARRVVGEDGILEWHSTFALGPDTCYLPQADAYVDFVLRGEGQGGRYTDGDYLRFFISGYNINNSIGVVCNNGPPGLTPELVRDALRVNARFHTIAGWLDQPVPMSLLREQYLAKLNPAMQAEVDREMDVRQAKVTAKAAAAREEMRRLRAMPAWKNPVRNVEFSQMPGAPQAASPANANPFPEANGVLRIEAHAHTHAFLRYPLDTQVSGFLLKVRQGSDGGMSWGPAALVRFADGATIRAGTRSDGLVQSDILGEQRCTGSFNVTDWVWLCVRWGERWGVVEFSHDGLAFERLLFFEHRGRLNQQAVELLVGKVPYNGSADDHTDAGPIGRCDIEFVKVYGD